MEFLNHFSYLRYLLLNFSDLKPDTRNRLTRSHLRRATSSAVQLSPLQLDKRPDRLALPPRDRTRLVRPRRPDLRRTHRLGHRDKNDTYDDFEPRSRHDDVSVHHFGVPYCGNTSTKSIVFFLPMKTTPKYVRGPIRRISSRIQFATSDVLE